MKNFFSALRPPHVFILFLLTAAAMGVLYSAYTLYVNEANKELPLAPSSPDGGQHPSIEEVRALFPQSSGDKEQLDAIAQKNLFSPERSPWTPPEQTGDDKDGQGGQESRRARVSHNGIRLYGTTLTDSKKIALVYFAPFQDKKKYRMVAEGEIARDKGERGEKVYFKVASITPDTVALEDPTGDQLTVGLYDHQRQAAQPQRQNSQIQVVIGGTEEPSAVSQSSGQRRQAEAAPERSSEEQGTSEGGPESEASESAQAGGEGQESPDDGDEQNEKARNIFELFKQLGTKGSGQDDLTQERKEELVKEGRMRKVETPFGTIYRPVD